ncbi:MAG: hypothetical protein E6R11_07140 [Rhodocyclaceae bacterium]|nr:MAG: hypothetical protein E6R11_07140 [Rhodocyclaceae bacterium]
MARFTMDTAVGRIEAESMEMLAIRVSEIPAMQTLSRHGHADSYAHAARARAMDKGEQFSRLMRHPLQTLRGVPAGVARYFGKRLRKIGKQAQSLSDHVARELGTRGESWPRSDGPMTSARDIDRQEARSNDAGHDSWLDDLGAETEREIKRRVEYRKARRDLAENLGIDPYTSNPILGERLDELAWSGSAGRLTADLAIASIDGSAGLLLARSDQLNELAWKLDEDQLRTVTLQRLERFARDEFLMRQFMRRGVFTPSLKASMLDALERLQPASGGDALLELAMTARSELEARYIVNALRLLATQLGNNAHGGELLIVGAGLGYLGNSRDVVLPLPVDYLSWTQEFASFLDNEEFRSARKSVIIQGNASPRSLRELTSRGWNIVVDSSSLVAAE